MAGYTKLFNSILASTIWREPNHIRIVWITMLAMADRQGFVEASLPGLADFARVPLEACEEALSALQMPDKHSRSQEHAGRRIEAVDGGWRLLNHAKYRQKLSADERREYLRMKQREYRKRKRGVSNQSTYVNKVRDTSTVLTHTEAEAEAEAEEKQIQRASVCSSLKAENDGKLKDPDPNDPDIGERAAWFVHRYGTLYQQHRQGARYLPRPSLDFAKAQELCAIWPSDRLEKLAAVFLTTDHPFASSGSRTIGQFAALASWCDDKLREWERTHGASV